MLVVGLTTVGSQGTLAERGLPSAAEYMSQYQQHMGKPGQVPPAMPLYVSFVFFRLAAILQGVYKRAISGQVEVQKFLYSDYACCTLHAMCSSDWPISYRAYTNELYHIR